MLALTIINAVRFLTASRGPRYGYRVAFDLALAFRQIRIMPDIEHDAARKSASPSGAPIIDAEKVKAQMRRWQDRVLDITKSNPLIGVNRSRVAKLCVSSPEPAKLFRQVVIDERELRMPLVRKPKAFGPNSDLFTDDTPAEFVVEPGDVSFDADAPDLMRRLRRIYDNARTTLEERGVTTLFLTFGALRWKDDQFGDSISPLWMVPCALSSKGPDVPLRLGLADEEAQLNPALEYYLRERHKIQLPAVPDEPSTSSLGDFLRSVEKVIRELKWEVSEEIWLSTFSFESLVIYQDLRALTGAATINPVVASLSRAVSAAGASESLTDDLDSLPLPGVVPVPTLPTDSSQLEALTHAASGRHLVVHGPPGTGKSQTIANLIADALARNQRVLFVSAKMAALNVVCDRLREVGLDRFCLEAHSTKAGKAKVIDELRRTIEAESATDSGKLQEELQSLIKVRDQLNAYVRALHSRVGPLGLTPYRAISRLSMLRSAPQVRAPIP